MDATDVSYVLLPWLVPCPIPPEVIWSTVIDKEPLAVGKGGSRPRPFHVKYIGIDSPSFYSNMGTQVLKKATIRKEQEPDFEEKRFNVTIGEDEREFDKENDFFRERNYRIIRE